MEPNRRPDRPDRQADKSVEEIAMVNLRRNRRNSVVARDFALTMPSDAPPVGAQQSRTQQSRAQQSTTRPPSIQEEFEIMAPTPQQAQARRRHFNGPLGSIPSTPIIAPVRPPGPVRPLLLERPTRSSSQQQQTQEAPSSSSSQEFEIQPPTQQQQQQRRRQFNGPLGSTPSPTSGSVRPQLSERPALQQAPSQGTTSMTTGQSYITGQHNASNTLPEWTYPRKNGRAESPAAGSSNYRNYVASGSAASSTRSSPASTSGAVENRRRQTVTGASNSRNYASGSAVYSDTSSSSTPNRAETSRRQRAPEQPTRRPPSPPSQRQQGGNGVEPRSSA